MKRRRVLGRRRAEKGSYGLIRYKQIQTKIRRRADPKHGPHDPSDQMSSLLDRT